MSEEVPVAPARSLEQCEAVIERGLRTFLEVGAALLEIRDGRLYRQDYGTFEDYCRDRWGFSRVQAHRLIEASEVVAMLPIGDTTHLPRNEAQARELARIPDPAERARVWQEVTEKHGEKVTAADIRRARVGFGAVVYETVRNCTPLLQDYLASLDRRQGRPYLDEEIQEELDTLAKARALIEEYKSALRREAGKWPKAAAS